MPGISLPPLCTLDLGQVGNDLPLDKTSPFKPVPGDVALWRKAKGEACIGQCFSENKSPKPKRNFHRPTSGPPTQGVLPRRRDSGSKRPPRSIECGGLCIYASPDSPSGKGGCTASPPHMGAGWGVNAASLLFTSFSVAHFLHFLLTSERGLRIMLFVACRCSSSGRAPPCQGGGSEFEPRHLLQEKKDTTYVVSFFF